MVDSDSIYDASGGEAFESRPIGEYLRQQRILRGMSAEELADLTRIPLRSLERLESGQFDGETDGFVRGFVRTVALALGLDTDDTVARMLQEPEASAWERHGPGRSAKQVFASVVFLVLLGSALLGLRAIWGLILGDASQPASREVVLWRDPVHALAAATGEDVDPTAGFDPRRDPSSSPNGAAQEAGRPAPESNAIAPSVGRERLGREEDRKARADEGRAPSAGQRATVAEQRGEGDDLVLAP